MNILEWLQALAIIIPAATEAIKTIVTAIHSVPGSAEHTEAVTKEVSPVPSIAPDVKESV